MAKRPNPAASPPADPSVSPTVRKRTRARELVLRALYLVDIRGLDSRSEIPPFFETEADDAEVRRFALELFDGCLARRAEIDERIATVAENWQIHRMAVIDRNVLRLGTYELMFCRDIPPKVSINEAIDLAKRYSTAESGAFVNGILDKLRTQLRADE